jgi:Nup93/Nic96
MDHGSVLTDTTFPNRFQGLRCGDAVAAREALHAQTEPFPEQSLIQAAIASLAQLQRNASCVWECGSVLPTQYRADLVDLLQKTLNLEKLGSSTDSKAKIGVVTWLSGHETYSQDSIEDYLFGLLWAALQNENPLPAIEKIGATIRTYGADHFGGPEENGGWGYALPLLVTQQFQTALTFLAQAGGANGLLQATHLGLVLSTAGIAIQDLGQSSSPSNDYLAPALVVKYASYLEQDPALGIEKALEYLLKIPSKEQSRNEISALICRSPYIVDQLVGTLQADGSRQEGELDKYMSREDVAAILTKAAETSRRAAQGDRAKAELAAKLFMLAGKFRSLLLLLNELITPADKDDDEKRYWWEQSYRFYVTYLAKGSMALSSLERENSIKLVATNRLLMECRQAFTTLRNEKYQEAFDMIMRMQLLPVTPEEFSVRESNYKDLDTIVKDQIPALLTAAVYSLHGMHRRIKSEARRVDDSVNFHLKDLQNKARFLYVFSGLTAMPNATKEEIQRLRNNMI